MKIKIILICFILNGICYADIESSMRISRSGVKVQQTKMQIIAENIANVHTTRTSEGGPYRRKDITVAETKDGIRVKKIYRDRKNLIRVYDPGHPDADKNGFVYYPNVNVTKELTDMAYSQKIYEANVVVYNTAKQMAQTIINIGK